MSTTARDPRKVDLDALEKLQKFTRIGQAERELIAMATAELRAARELLGAMSEKSGADMLAEWLAEEPENYTRVAFVHKPPGRKRWSCVAEERFVPGKDDSSTEVISIATNRGDGPTPDAAMRAAVEKARRG